VDTGNARVRRILVATVNVTTVAPLPAGTYGYYLCIASNNGTFLYVTTSYAVVRVNGALLALAGDASNPGGFVDGVGSSARFSNTRGIALNTDESALVIVDRDNRRIRKLLLANNSVTTVAGSGAGGGLVDGPALTATFSSAAFGAKWHCNATNERTCGVLVADYGNGAVRFVALETDATPTAAATGATATAQCVGMSMTDTRPIVDRHWWHSYSRDDVAFNHIATNTNGIYAAHHVEHVNGQRNPNPNTHICLQASKLWTAGPHY
jgi:hypothetical protein